MDPQLKKKALRMVSYGLYVATARAGEKYAAGTVTWLSQCSFEPPLVMAGIRRDSALYKTIKSSHAFAVHIVGKSQKKLATTFFKTVEVDGDKLSGYRFEAGKTGSPVLADAAAWFECRVVDEVKRGDHTVFVAEVVAAGVRREEEPLTVRAAGFAYGG
jgi:flavin reductase (DIM6/NTAB) family NADH-FMN oxidoreductase RutF